MGFYMLVSEAITLLQNSELKQLNIKDDSAAILGYINFGILEIHKRFLLWEAEAVVTQATGVELYTMKEADTNVDIDLSDHEFLTIERVFDEDNKLYLLNNEKDADSLHTPRIDQLKVNTIVPNYEMSVRYRASPKFLTLVTDIIPLQSQFYEALFLYVAYKGHLSVKSGVKDENNTHYIRFEASCDRISMEGLHIQNDLTSTKFEQRGFV